MLENYDEKIKSENELAEKRLIDHFVQEGGEVWQITSGCNYCKAKSAEMNCSKCKTALFCNRACQEKGWKDHKFECFTISTLFNSPNDFESTIDEILQSIKCPKVNLTQRMEEMKQCGLSIPESSLSEWIAKDLRQDSSSIIKQFVILYGLLRDEESFTRDTKSFPRSSYTLCKDIQQAGSIHREKAIEYFISKNGHLSLFSAWLQKPQVPATQYRPFESRELFGIIDSLLQINELRQGIDNFLDSI